MIGENLKKQLGMCEFTAVNFEAPIEYDNGLAIKKSGPHVRQSRNTPRWLEENGINIISFANNHIMDFGPERLKVTLECFKKSVLLGIGDYSSAYEPTIIESKGIKIAFLAATHKEFGCVDVREPDLIGTTMATSPKFLAAIKHASEICDRVYVIPHAGVEYTDAPLPEWREMYKSYIDMGADAVIGSHPHVPQGWEIYKGRPIVYSLGNFLFEVPYRAERSMLWYQSNLAVVDTETFQLEILPLFYNHQTLEVDIDTSGERKQYNSYLFSLINDEKRYNEYLDRLDENLRRSYLNLMKIGGGRGMGLKEKVKNFIKPFLGKIVVPPSIHLLNLYQCESHRWMTERLLKKGKL